MNSLNPLRPPLLQARFLKFLERGLISTVRIVYDNDHPHGVVTVNLPDDVKTYVSIASFLAAQKAAKPEPDRKIELQTRFRNNYERFLEEECKVDVSAIVDQPTFDAAVAALSYDHRTKWRKARDALKKERKARKEQSRAERTAVA